MKYLNDIKLLFMRSFNQAMRNKLWVAVGFSAPLLYLALFTPLLQKLTNQPGFPPGNALNMFLPGMLALMAFNNGAGNGYRAMNELLDGTTERFRVTPASRITLLITPILSNIVWFYIFISILIIASVPFGFDLHIPGMLVSLLLMAFIIITSSAFAVSVAFKTKNMSSLDAIITALNLPLILLSGILLPLSIGPAWILAIAHINPLYYVVKANRLLAAGNIVNAPVGLAFLVMIILTCVTLMWTTRIYRKALI